VIRDRRSCGRGHCAAGASATGLLDIVRAGPESAPHFDDGVSSLVLEHFQFGPLGPFPFLSPDFLDPLLLLALFSEDYGFDLVGQDAAGQEPVDGLGPFPLALDLNASGQVFQIDAGRNFIDVLPALSLGADKFLDEVAFPNVEALHLAAQGLFFFGAQSKAQHGVKVIDFTNNVKDLAGIRKS